MAKKNIWGDLTGPAEFMAGKKVVTASTPEGEFFDSKLWADLKKDEVARRESFEEEYLTTPAPTSSWGELGTPGVGRNRDSVMSALRAIRELRGVSMVDGGRDLSPHQKLARALRDRLYALLELGQTGEAVATLVLRWQDIHTRALTNALKGGTLLNHELRKLEAAEKVGGGIGGGRGKGKFVSPPVSDPFEGVGSVEQAMIDNLMIPKAEHSAEAQLEIDLEQAALEADPEHGAW